MTIPQPTQQRSPEPIPVVASGVDPVRLLWLDSKEQRVGETALWTWEDLANMARDPVNVPVGGKGALSLVCNAICPSDSRAAGAEPTGYDLLILDYDDDQTVTASRLREWWGGLRLVAHSSFSHAPERPRWRVYLPISRTVNPVEYQQVAKFILNCGRGRMGSTELRSKVRPYFVAARTPHYECLVDLSGGAIDVDLLLGSMPTPQPGQPLVKEAPSYADSRSEALFRGRVEVAVERLRGLASGRYDAVRNEALAIGGRAEWAPHLIDWAQSRLLGASADNGCLRDHGSAVQRAIEWALTEGRKAPIAQPEDRPLSVPVWRPLGGGAAQSTTRAPPDLDLVVSKQGRPLACAVNVARVLEHDPEFAGRLSFCEFTNEPLKEGKPIEESAMGEAVLHLGSRYDLHVSRELVVQNLMTVCYRRQVHPVREFLDSLSWDRIPRIEQWFHRALGCSDDALSAAYGAKFLIGAVARVMDPGCKVDSLPVLQGPQGAGKSTAFRELVPRSEWFSDSGLEIGSKDAYQNLSGVWIYELGELASLRGREVEAIRNFLSSPSDRYRASYARKAQSWPRQNVFCGTTNETTVLNDPAGSRRFWVRRVGTIRIDLIRRNRTMLWAEALHRYRQGEPWWLDADHEHLRMEAAEQFTATDPWESTIDDWLRGRDGVTMAEILSGAMDKPASLHSKSDEIRIGNLLARWGWTKARDPKAPKFGGKRHIRWWRP